MCTKDWYLMVLRLWITSNALTRRAAVLRRENAFCFLCVRCDSEVSKLYSTMTFQQFNASLTSTQPPQMDVLLTSLWYDAKENWEKAHDLVNDLGGKDAAWVHAYLHRKEGDLGNASYWYHRANKKVATSSLEEEWEEIVKALLR
jgi:hypothetical protein